MVVKKSIKRKNRKIRKTKKHIYKRVKRGGEGDDDTRENECPICFSDMTENEKLTAPCGHSFHKNCIKRWCNINCTCPVCRDTRLYDFILNQQANEPRSNVRELTQQELDKRELFLDYIDEFLMESILPRHYVRNSNPRNSKENILESQIRKVARYINQYYYISGLAAANGREQFPKTFFRKGYDLIKFVIEEEDGIPLLSSPEIISEFPRDYDKDRSLIIHFYPTVSNEIYIWTFK